MAAMLFEIHLARGADPTQLISADNLRDAKARLMTWDEARAGLANLPEPPADKVVRYISAIGRDAKWIHHMLENHPLVTKIKTYEVE
jgi:hypothetical protein